MSNHTFALKDECPYPDLYWAERPHSIIIETSQFDPATFDMPSLLTLLRDQCLQAISVNQRTITKYNNRSESRGKDGLFIEVGFPDEDARVKALNTPLILNDKTIQVIKTLEKPDFYYGVHRIQIYGIDKVADPSKYYDEVMDYLNKYGQVLKLHLHYTKVGNWFTGEGCAIWINEAFERNKKGFYNFCKHPQLGFAVITSYKLNNCY